MSNKYFKKIIGIGFEFETHDICKLSMNKKNILINSNLSPRNIIESSKQDEHYYLIKYDNNEKEYLEYYDESTITNSFNITNDLALSDFTNILQYDIGCEKIDVFSDKNDMFIYKTTKGDIYKLHFSDILKDFCYNFSGVEWISTFLKQLPNENIILDKYIESCRQIIKHLSNLTEIKGNLYLNETPPSKIGNMKYRYLYHKPETNLFYMQTYDISGKKSNKTLNDIIIIPQMTFSCNIIDSIDIVQSILNNEELWSGEKRTITNMKYEHKVNMKIIKTSNNLIENYIKNTQNKNLLNINDENLKKIILNYLFLFYYKVYYYVNIYSQIKDTENDYFKDYLSFNTRHHNSDLILAIKNNIAKLLKLKLSTNKDKINESLKFLLYDKTILSEFIYKNNMCALSNDTEHLKNDYKNNPNISFISYLNNILKNKDWFSNIETSTFYPLKNNIVLIENRYFNDELKVVYKNNANISLQNGSFSLKTMIKFTEKY